MNLTIGATYKLIIKVDRVLTYEATITSIDEDFVTFIDKFGKEYSFRKSTVISYNIIKEVGEDE